MTDGPGHYTNGERCEVESLKLLIVVTASQYEIEASYDYVTINGVPYPHSIPKKGVVMHKGHRLVWRSDSSVTLPGFTLCAQDASGT